MRSLPPRWRAALYIIAVACLLPLALAPLNGPISRGILSSGSPLWHAGLLWAAFLSALLPTLLAARLENRRLADYGLPCNKATVLRLVEGAAWGSMACALFVAILKVVRLASFQPVSASWSAAAVAAAEWGIALAGLALFEECVMRGYLQATLSASMGFWRAALLISTLFALEKLLSEDYRQVGALAGAVFYALLCCYSLRRTGSLWFGVGFNTALAWCAVFLFGIGIPISGSNPVGALFRVQVHGPAWLTGGASTIHAGLLSAIVLALVCLGLRFRFVTITVSETYRDSSHPTATEP